MDDSEATSLEQIRAFLAGSAPVQFSGCGREEVYAWSEKTLVRHEYASLGKAGKGLVRQYLAWISHRICQWSQGSEVKWQITRE